MGRGDAKLLARGVLQPLAQRGEMGTGVRLGGIFDDQIPGRTKSIWKARPPVAEDGRPYPVLSLGTEHDSGTPAGNTVTILAEAATQWGGRVLRKFEIGGGLSADLRLGMYETCNVRIGSIIPPGMRVKFVWSEDYTIQPSPLYTFINYPVAAADFRLPQGTAIVIPELACTLTWLLPQFTTTFVNPTAAGEEAPALWAAFRCNIINKFIFRLRGI